MNKLFFGLSVVAALSLSAFAEGNVSNESNVSNVNNEPESTGIIAWLHKSVYSTNSALPKGTLQDTVSKLAEDLYSEFKKNEVGTKSIAIVSFVDLHKLNKTTNFGRTISESMFNEMFKKGFNVMDIRVQKGFEVNANGEYLISRDVKRLNESVESDFALVGTYVQIAEGALINARIINTMTGKVVATSRVVYADKSCEIFENCKPIVIPEKVVEKVVEKIVYVEKEYPAAKMRITTDGCSAVECPCMSEEGNCK